MFSIKFRQYVTVCVAMLRDVSGANQSGQQNNYFADNSDFILILNDCRECVCVCVCVCVLVAWVVLAKCSYCQAVKNNYWLGLRFDLIFNKNVCGFSL